VAEAGTQTTTPPARPRLRWWKRCLRWLLVLMLVAGVAVWILLFMADRELRQATADADRLDPGWRYEDLEKKRATIPDEENSALQVLAVAKLLPTPWPPTPLPAGFKDLVLDQILIDPSTRLDDQQIDALHAALEAAKPALPEARKLAAMSRGRYPMLFDDHGLPASGAHRQAIQSVSTLLAYEALRQSLDGDADAALESCRALMNLVRSVGDQPEEFFQIYRMRLRGEACRIIEACLERGKASPATLASLQKVLEDEEADPAFLHGARGFRAWMDQILEVAKSGNAPTRGPERILVMGLARSARGEILRANNRIVEIAKLPVEDHAEALTVAMPKEEDMSILGQIYLLPKLQKLTQDLATGQIESQAELRCAITAIAAQRYRQRHGRWPLTAAALVPEHLGAVLRDPFDAQPLRIRQVIGGRLIYSVGPDRANSGGTIDRSQKNATGTDLGFRVLEN